jgi:uncharacterized protein YeaO (DUF488 family)
VPFELKRAYEAADPADGYRVLVDRLWPRGLTKEGARIDLWLQDVAPTPGLRTWFHHDPARWDEFRIEYLRELEGREQAINALVDAEKRAGRVTLVYAAKDADHNHAKVIAEFLASRV